MRWTEFAYQSGGLTFNVNGNKITTPEDPAIEGSYEKDGSVVFYDVNDKETPVAVWSRKGMHVLKGRDFQNCLFIKEIWGKINIYF